MRTVDKVDEGRLIGPEETRPVYDISTLNQMRAKRLMRDLDQ